MSSTALDALEAEYALRREEIGLTDRLLALKNDPKRDADEYTQVKVELRELRRYWREIREFLGTSVAAGDAVVTPETATFDSDISEVSY